MKLPLMVLLSIKSKSYGRLHSAHYKQVILKDKRVLAFKYRAAGWVGARTQQGNSRNKSGFHTSVLYSSCIEGWSPKIISHLLVFPPPIHPVSCAPTKVDVSSPSSDAHLRVLPPCNGHGCYQLTPGLHICQSPHAPFTPRHRNTNTALMHFKKILACLKEKGSMNI